MYELFEIGQFLVIFSHFIFLTSFAFCCCSLVSLTPFFCGISFFLLIEKHIPAYVKFCRNIMLMYKYMLCFHCSIEAISVCICFCVLHVKWMLLLSMCCYCWSDLLNFLQYWVYIHIFSFLLLVLCRKYDNAISNVFGCWNEGVLYSKNSDKKRHFRSLNINYNAWTTTTTTATKI